MDAVLQHYRRMEGQTTLSSIKLMLTLLFEALNCCHFKKLVSMQLVVDGYNGYSKFGVNTFRLVDFVHQTVVCWLSHMSVHALILIVLLQLLLPPGTLFLFTIVTVPPYLVSAVNSKLFSTN